MLKVFEVKDSSFVSKIGFDGGNIFVKLISGKCYRYGNLTEEVFEKFCATQSKGTFLNKTLKRLRRGVRCANQEL